MNVMIATPRYGGQVHATFAMSLIRTVAESSRWRIVGDRREPGGDRAAAALEPAGRAPRGGC